MSFLHKVVRSPRFAWFYRVVCQPILATSCFHIPCRRSVLLHLILFAILVSASSCIAKLLEATLPLELC